MSEDTLSRTRKQIQQKIAQQEQSKKLELQRRRIEIAGRGVAAYAKKDMVGAALAFKSYLSILEDIKGAPSGGLSPTHFDKKKDMAEMVLITGVLWDLIKLYDRTQSPDKYKEFQAYMSKYIAFARGMPYQTMCAETLRKYIRDKRAVHMNEFKDAYKMIKNSRCFIATELEPETRFETLPRLREFRDRVLKRRKIGRKFVAWYYRRGPTVAERLSHAPKTLRVLMAKILDNIASLVDLYLC
jgi:hypothetical protein